MDVVIAAAQSKSVAGDVADNVARHLRFGAKAAELGAQLVVFPELSVTGYDLSIARAHAVRPDSPALGPLQRLADETRIILVVGAPVRNDGGELQIAALVVRPDLPVATHAKAHPTPTERTVFVPGPTGPALQLGATHVALAICADTSHPQHAANAAAQGAHVYAAGSLLTADAYGRDAARLQGYAARHRMAVLLANYSGASGGWESAGRSAVWSEDGALVVASDGNEEALVIAARRNGAWSGFVAPMPQ